jgi:hypothetical protein
MGATRFYKPAPAKLAGKELMFAGGNLDWGYRRAAGVDTPDFDFAASVLPHKIITRRIVLRGNNAPEDFEPEFFDMGPFQITYNFSRAVRKNTFPLKNALSLRPKVKGEYGADGWSFRMLYEFLCEFYNGGRPFVDVYFERIFKTRSVYARLKSIYSTIQDDINEEQLALFMSLPLRKDGMPDMRYAASRSFKDFKAWQNPIVKQDCKDLAKDIRNDIVVCLSTGRIPLRKQQVSRRGTGQARARFVGLHPSQFFFASGQLIRHLNIYVEVGKAS